MSSHSIRPIFSKSCGDAALFPDLSWYVCSAKQRGDQRLSCLSAGGGGLGIERIPKPRRSNYLLTRTTQVILSSTELGVGYDRNQRTNVHIGPSDGGISNG